jgi:hypothetical protein
MGATAGVFWVDAFAVSLDKKSIYNLKFYKTVLY